MQREVIKKQLIQLQVEKDGDTVSTTSVTTDENYDEVIGYRLYLSAINAERKSVCQLKIDGLEIEPERYPAEGLMCTTSVSPNDRYKNVPFPVKAKGSLVNFSYTDGSASTVPYKVMLVLILKINHEAGRN